jgi:hypothetical protein
MNRRENTFKKYIRKTMGTRWCMQSHEDMYSEGIADLSFSARGVNGWIELKQIAKFPDNAEVKIKPVKYTAEQVNWINRKQRFGGHSFVFVKVGNEDYFLFPACRARMVAKGMSIYDYDKLCIRRWGSPLNPVQFLDEITDPRHSSKTTWERRAGE